MLFHHEQEVGAVLDVFVAEGGSLETGAVEVDRLDADMVGAPVLGADREGAAVGEADGDAGEAGGTQFVFVASGA